VALEEAAQAKPTFSSTDIVFYFWPLLLLLLCYAAPCPLDSLRIRILELGRRGFVISSRKMKLYVVAAHEREQFKIPVQNFSRGRTCIESLIWVYWLY
jgi:hypothetical protein